MESEFHYCVKYVWQSSRYFDTPLSVAYKWFDTMGEAVRWAHAPHPELKRFNVLRISEEPRHIDITVHPAASGAERRGISDRCTDVCIVSRY